MADTEDKKDKTILDAVKDVATNVVEGVKETSEPVSTVVKAVADVPKIDEQLSEGEASTVPDVPKEEPDYKQMYNDLKAKYEPDGQEVNYKELYEKTKKEYEDRFNGDYNTVDRTTEQQEANLEQDKADGTYDGLFGDVRQNHAEQQLAQQKEARSIAGQAVESGDYTQLGKWMRNTKDVRQAGTDALRQSMQERREKVRKNSFANLFE